MYAFVNTVNSGIVGTNLPTEAMSYNGVYLENEIDGYRTLSVTGRELMESEVAHTEIDGMDGSYYRYKTTPARTITVRYQLRARGSREFREAYNKMNKLLSGEQVKVIFNDESDKYFIGTKTSNTQVDGGSNNVIGEIEIYCSDPRKYSTTEKEFTATDGVLNIVNEGTVPVSIDYEIETVEENGYIGITSSEGMMQFGYVEENKGEPVLKNESIINLNAFYDAKDDVNGTDYMHPTYGTSGTLVPHYHYYEDIGINGRYLGLGTSGEKKGWAYGGLRTVTLPPDSNGHYGSVNFSVDMQLVFYAGLMGQCGEVCVNFLTGDNKLICGCNLYKSDEVGNTAHYEILANGNVLKNWSFTSSHLQNENPFYWGWNGCTVLKEGANIRFSYFGQYYSFYIPEIEEMECKKIQVAVKRCDTDDSKIMNYMGVEALFFSKMHVKKWKDVPNRYPVGSKISIDGATSHYYVDGIYRPQDEVLGTKYFKAPVGATEVQIHVSSSTEKLPKVKARIREAWI